MVTATRKAIGFDIGGTKISCGVITDKGDPVETLLPMHTPTDPTGTLDALRTAIQELRGRHPEVSAIGVGAAGLIEWPGGHIRWAPNNSYHDMPLRRLLEDSCELPTVVDNDANVAAWAEQVLSSAPNYMLFLTVGTGVGGGLVLGGELYRGKSGIGGEVGHLIVDPRGNIRCGCGNLGCLEAVASGTALGRYGREAATADPGGTLATLAGDPAKVNGETVFAAALAGDLASRAILRRAGDWLGIGIASLVNVLDLERIVIGGGVAAAGDLLLDSARASLERYLFARAHRRIPEVVAAAQGADAGWMGAGLLALNENAGMPSPV
ncbi:ROK family protein [Rugosimonospora africana]|uniref:ROK family protein n=1 Tax=Rugosimonospora africana TaxID=556532 RepID=UPI00194199CA|nr:ROK family protein [Rugosimonospora africana]